MITYRMTEGTNKASALVTVSEHLNIGLENIVAFGDGNNDAEMLAEVMLRNSIMIEIMRICIKYIYVMCIFVWIDLGWHGNRDEKCTSNGKRKSKSCISMVKF